MPPQNLNRVVIAGGTGLVGRALVKALVVQGVRVAVLTRNPEGLTLPEGATAQGWDHLAEVLDGADALVNLAGEGIADQRWTPRRKQALRDSRILTTRRLVHAMKDCARPPAALVNASAIGYYVPGGSGPVDEAAHPGTSFLAAVCRDWEAEAMAATGLGTRVSVVRIGVVLAREGGAFPKMVRPIRAYLGCPLGDGDQGLSWIHLDDLVALLLEAARNPAWSGVYNGTAPTPVSNRAFTQLLARRLGRPLLPVPGVLTRTALRLLLGELAEELLLQGAFVLPTRALAQGFRFRFPEAGAAVEDLL